MGKREVVIETKQQLKLAAPLVAVNVLQFVQQTVSLMLVGQLGELILSGASMALSFAQVSGFRVVLGMASALETLCGQAFGAEQHSVLGIHMQRAMLILSLVSLPISVIWAFTGQILHALGQDAEISAEAGVFARWMIPCIFAYSLIHCQLRFLQSQNIVVPQMLITGVATLLHIPICWSLVYKSELGSRGAALANTIVLWLTLLFLATYIKLSPRCKRSWTGFSKKAFTGIPAFIRLAIPSALMVCLEGWSFETVLLLSGLLPNPKLEASVLSICLTTSTVVFMVLSGFSSTISTRVSNELGANRPNTARLAVWVMLCITTTEGLTVGVTIVLVRNLWGKLFSKEAEVVQHVAQILPLLAFSHFINGMQAVLSGAIRGCGRQKIGAYINLGAYYVVGIPVSAVLAFVFHFREEGLWTGMICALGAQDVLFAVIMLRTNWEKQAQDAAAQVNNSVQVPL